MLCKFSKVSTVADGLLPSLLGVYTILVTHQNKSENLVEFPKGKKVSKYQGSHFFTLITIQEHGWDHQE